MTEYWQRTTITGTGAEGFSATETILHRRGEDVLGMAMRRNPGMAGCSRFETETEEVFTVRRDEDGRRRKYDIPRDPRGGEEWDW